MTRKAPEEIPSFEEVSRELFGEMRQSTERERLLLRKLLERTSKPIGINVFDLLEGEE